MIFVCGRQGCVDEFPSYIICSVVSYSLTAVLTNFDIPLYTHAHTKPELTDPAYFPDFPSLCVCVRTCCLQMHAQASVSGVLIKIVWELMLYSCSTAPIATEFSTSCQVIRRANTCSPASSAASRLGLRS